MKKLGETDLTVDMREPKNIENQNAMLVSSTPNLTEMELEALKSAISEDFIKKQGWTGKLITFYRKQNEETTTKH